MTLAFGIATYFICWWMVFFAVLPFGVRTYYDDASGEPGNADSAPIAPNLLLKMAITTVIAGFLFAFLYAVVELKLIALDDIPFLPRFDTVK